MGKIRKFIKRCILILVFPLALPFIIIVRFLSLLGMEEPFVTFACLLSLIPGVFGSMLRVAYYKGTLKKMGSDVKIGFGSFFSKRSAEVYNDVFIGAYAVLGTVVLRDFAMVGTRVSIPSGRRQHGDSRTGVLYDIDIRYQQITIGERSMIGEGSIVMANVGERCMVGSGSVVTKDVPDNSVVVGNPARPISSKK